MIIARYLTRQILAVTAAITFVLLAVVVLGRMLTYLGQAAEGAIDSGVVVLIMTYRLPEFFQLTLPLAFTLGILIALGKLYADSEITVLSACGISRKHLLGITGISASVIALLVAVLALKVTPSGLVNAETLLQAQKELTEFEVLVPGVFQSLSRGERTTYTENSEDGQLDNVFMHESTSNRVTVARSAEVSEDSTGNRIVLMTQGSLTEGLAGGEQQSVTTFAELGVRMPAREIDIEIDLEEKALPTMELMRSSITAGKAELQWRISLVVIIPVLALLVVPLSRVSPRQGRFARLVPAFAIYILYFGLLLASRDLVADGEISVFFGLWWVHLLFIGLALFLYTDKAPAWLGGQ